MKRTRLGLQTLALVLVVLMAMPAVAGATRPGAFTGSGSAAITYLPEPVAIAPFVLVFEDEVVQGVVDESDWPELRGAEVLSVHTSVAAFNPVTFRTVGVLRGSFVITRGEDRLEGTLTARQSGNLFGDINSNGVWRVTSKTGIFENVAPVGTWRSTFGGDLTGRFTLSGRMAQ